MNDILIAQYRLDDNTSLTATFTCVGRMLELTVVDRRFGTKRALQRTCFEGKRGFVRTALQLMLMKLKAAAAPEYAAAIAEISRQVVDDITEWILVKREEQCGRFF